MTKPKRPSVLSLTGIRLKESRGEALGSLWQWYIEYRACQELWAASSLSAGLLGRKQHQPPALLICPPCHPNPRLPF